MDEDPVSAPEPTPYDALIAAIADAFPALAHGNAPPFVPVRRVAFSMGIPLLALLHRMTEVGADHLVWGTGQAAEIMAQRFERAFEGLGAETAWACQDGWPRPSRVPRKLADASVEVDALADFLCVEAATLREVLGLVGAGAARPDTVAVDTIWRTLQRGGAARTRRAAVPSDRVFERDGKLCRYCGRRLTRYTRVVDHIVPVSRGGTNEMGNLAAACRSCNAVKGARTPQEAGLTLRPAPG